MNYDQPLDEYICSGLRRVAKQCAQGTRRFSAEKKLNRGSRHKDLIGLLRCRLAKMIRSHTHSCIRVLECPIVCPTLLTYFPDGLCLHGLVAYKYVISTRLLLLIRL